MDIFEKNIRLLQQKNGPLADYIRMLEIPNNIMAVKSKSGFRTLKVVEHSGRERFLHSPDDPMMEAKNLLRDYSFKREDGTILLGFGLGYLAAEIAKEKERGHILFIAEGMPALFKLAAKHTDLSDLLDDNQIFFFIGDSIGKITDHFNPMLIKAFTGTINKLAVPPLMSLCAGAYQEIDHRVNEHVICMKIGQESFDGNRALYLANPLENIPALVSSSSISSVENMIKGRPALVVAGGPSLTNDMDVLKQKHHGAFMIAVDSALKPLLEHGIRPDLAVTCDPLPLNADKIAGLSQEVLASIPLVYHLDACPQLIEKFKNIKLVAGSHNLLSSWLVKLGHHAISFAYYHSVSHLGFLLARFMGADPIILVGLDLSFPVDRTHAKGSAKTWNVDFENGEFIMVPSNDGGRVRTIPVFTADIRVMEREVRDTSSRCINVSQAGALIKGTEVMSLKETMNIHGKHDQKGPSPHFRDLVAEFHDAEPPLLRARYLKALKWLLSEADEIIPICEEALDIKNSREQEGFHRDENKKRTRRLYTLYEAALKHKKFLRVLKDFFPRHNIACAKSLTDEITPVHSDSSDSQTEKIYLFFEELNGFLPDLLSHSQQVLAKLETSFTTDSDQPKAI